MSERRKFTDYEKKTVYAKANGHCALCGMPVKYKKMTVDHKIPLSHGGTNEICNLQLACLSCNRAKQDISEKEPESDCNVSCETGFNFEKGGSVK